MIEKILHRIWIGPNPKPETYAAYGEKFRAKNPDWQMMDWHNGNMPQLVNQDWFDNANDYGAKANILRYEIILAFGGVYFDIDVEPVKTIPNSIMELDFFASEYREGYAGNFVFGASKDNIFLSQLIESIQNYSAPSASRFGSIYLDLEIKKRGKIILPREIFCPKNSLAVDSTIAIHHWGGNR